ncbi:MAG: vertnin [Nitrososphaerales archaeon]
MRHCPTTATTRQVRQMLESDFKQPPLRKSSDTLPTAYIDTVAVAILQRFTPVTLEEWTPLQTVPDGNCMYRAASLGLFGTQEYHIYIRVLAALEIIENRDYYDTASASYARTITDTRILSPPYCELVKSITTPGSYGELLHMYAFSAAFQVPVTSFCPSSSSWMTSVHPYSLVIYGRNVRRTTNPDIFLLWTWTSATSNLNGESANHVVYLERKTVGQSCAIDINIGEDQWLKWAGTPRYAVPSPRFFRVHSTAS